MPPKFQANNHEVRLINLLLELSYNLLANCTLIFSLFWLLESPRHAWILDAHCPFNLRSSGAKEQIEDTWEVPLEEQEKWLSFGSPKTNLTKGSILPKWNGRERNLSPKLIRFLNGRQRCWSWYLISSGHGPLFCSLFFSEARDKTATVLFELIRSGANTEQGVQIQNQPINLAFQVLQSLSWDSFRETWRQNPSLKLVTPSSSHDDLFGASDPFLKASLL